VLGSGCIRLASRCSLAEVCAIWVEISLAVCAKADLFEGLALLFGVLKVWL